MQTLSDYLNNSASLDAPGTYEFYELNSSNDISRRFIIKNLITNKSILIQSIQNKIEIDQNFSEYDNLGGTKISILKFFERLKGLGVNYV